MKLWLTYAWKDNETADVDFVCQELERQGLTVRFDRVELNAGRRLWPAIDQYITDPAESDAWALYTTKTSLQSEPCQEELSYALERALGSRGSNFPLIGIFPRPVDRELIPSAIATRLYVTLRDPDWAKRIAASLTGDALPRPAPVENYVLDIHELADGGLAIEVRPRAGRWYPAVVRISDEVEFGMVWQAPSGGPPNRGASLTRALPSEPGYRSMMLLQAIDPLTSMYAYVDRLPRYFEFGSQAEHFIVRF